MNQLLKLLKVNNMPKLLLWFFIYTILTFIFGILCKVLVAWHVNDMHTDLTTTSHLFSIAAEQGGSLKNTAILQLASNKTITFGDILALDYLSAHQNDVHAGDGTLDRFYIYSKHIMGNEQKFADLKALMNAVVGSGQIDLASQLHGLSLLDVKLLEPVANFQNDIARDAIYASSMQSEANLVFWLQIGLIALTLIAYPYGIYKLWLIKHNTKYQYDAKTHKRLIMEYLMFLVFFIIIDTYATYLLIAEDVPMTFWNAFSVGSMAVPTGFAIGSLIFIWLNKKHVVDKENLELKFNWKKSAAQKEKNE